MSDTAVKGEYKFLTSILSLRPAIRLMRLELLSGLRKSGSLSNLYFRPIFQSYENPATLGDRSIIHIFSLLRRKGIH